MPKEKFDSKRTPMSALRDATHDLHERLEASFPWEQAFASGENYVRLLRALHELVRPADEAIAAQLTGEGPLATQRRRATWIVEDLRRLGVEPSRAPAQAADFRFVNSPGRALGCLYVLEGSALGAQYLSRQLQARLGITPETGGRYLGAYGDRTGERWNGFREWANGELQSPELLNEAIFASLRTFERFSEHLTGLFDV